MRSRLSRSDGASAGRADWPLARAGAGILSDGTGGQGRGNTLVVSSQAVTAFVRIPVSNTTTANRVIFFLRGDSSKNQDYTSAKCPELRGRNALSGWSK